MIDGERVAVLMLSMTHGMQHFFGRIFPPLIPLLATDLSLSLWKLGLIVTVWSMANGLAQTPMGQLSDRFDRRFLLPTGVLLVGMGYLIVASSTAMGGILPTLTLAGTTWTGTLTVITAGMIVAGVGKAATHPTGYPLLSANVQDGRKGRALGTWGSASKFGDAAGPAFVGILLLLLTWQQVFTAVAGIALVYAVLLFQYMTASSLTTVPDTGGGDGSDAQDDYWVPLMLVLVAMVAAGFATKGVGTYLPAFITEVYGFGLGVGGLTVGPESLASLYFSAMLLTAALVMLVIGRLIDRYEPWDIMIVLYTVAACAVAALAVLPLTMVTLLLVAVVIGGTLFAANPARDAIVSRVAPADHEGRVFGYFWTALLLVTAVFPTLVGYLGDLVGLRQGFVYLTIGPVLGIIPLLVLRWRYGEG